MIMREIVLDTETTGFYPLNGDKIVEIGAVELINHIPTDKVYHQYINPEREMPQAAFNVHGLSTQFLADKPNFKAIADDFLDFIGDSPLIIHNARFDMGFLNHELSQLKTPKNITNSVIDTLDMARKKYPGAQNSLDALCARFDVSNEKRIKHGALLDSEILAEVYLHLIGGSQKHFLLSNDDKDHGQSNNALTSSNDLQRQTPLKPRLTEAEEKAHQAFIETLSQPAMWKTLN